MNFGWIKEHLDKLHLIGFHFWMALKVVKAPLARDDNVIGRTIRP